MKKQCFLLAVIAIALTAWAEEHKVLQVHQGTQVQEVRLAEIDSVLFVKQGTDAEPYKVLQVKKDLQVTYEVRLTEVDSLSFAVRDKDVNTGDVVVDEWGDGGSTNGEAEEM